ncbi:hypothetical protein D3C81_1217370 [compost metagenome]
MNLVEDDHSDCAVLRHLLNAEQYIEDDLLIFSKWNRLLRAFVFLARISQALDVHDQEELAHVALQVCEAIFHGALFEFAVSVRTGANDSCLLVRVNANLVIPVMLY